VYGELEYTAVQLGGVGWLLDAFLELDVLVPERMALEIKTNKVRASLEKTILLASIFMERGVGEWIGRGDLALVMRHPCSQASK
jgi:hypothetical protein